MYKLGILGLGKMGSSILRGVVDAKLYEKKDIYLYMPNKDHQDEYRKDGFPVAKDERDLFINSECILLAIKPQKFSEVLVNAKDFDFKDRCVISIAAGIKIESIEGYFKNALIVRTMPNTPALIKSATTTICTKDKNDPLFEKALEIFKSIGTYEVIDEEMMDDCLPLNGSMPAYLYLFAKAFIDNATEKGIDYETAKRLCLESIIGSSKLVLSSNDSIDQLIKNVCSPKGTTLEGLECLYNEGFEKAIKDCADACARRSRELSK